MNTTSIILAIDLGTQSLRVSALSTSGARLWSWAHPVESLIDGHVFEQSPAEWVELLDTALDQARAAGISPDGIAVAAPLAGFIAMDQEGLSLTPAVMYADRRSAAHIAKVENAVARHPHANPNGLRVYVPDPLPQLLRLRRDSPGIFGRTVKFLDATGWLNHYLTGVATLNSYTALRLYDSAVRAELDVDASVFGQPVAIGQTIGLLDAGVAARFGMRQVPVIAATFDSKCAYIASGIRRPGQATDISGTVTSFGVVTQSPFVDPLQRVYSVPFGEQTWLARGSTASSGGILEWARVNLLQTDFATLDKSALEARAGADGLIFLPYLAGERSPLWNPHARGALLGLSLNTSRASMGRAVYEGLAFALRHIVSAMYECGIDVTDIRLAGGLARNATLSQIKADVLGKPVFRLRDAELTTLGLAVIASVALGAWPDHASASLAFNSIEQRFDPDMSEHRVHTLNFDRYCAYVGALQSTFVPGPSAVNDEAAK